MTDHRQTVVLLLRGRELARALPTLRQLEELVAALKGTAGFYWALWQEVQHGWHIFLSRREN